MNTMQWTIPRQRRLLEGTVDMATWTFSLIITNATDRELEVYQSQLHWGNWNTNNIEDHGPINIPPKTTLQAMGVKAASGPNGYECSCSWRDKAPSSEKSYGIVSMSLDVPHTGKNSAECKATGRLHIDSWEDLPKDGHNFVRSIIVTKKQN